MRMKKVILFILCLAIVSGVTAQDVSVRLSEAGTLAQELSNQKETALTIKVAGPVNAADFKTLWEASLYGELRHLDLAEADAEGNKIPDNAFWDSGIQAGGNAIKLESIVLPSNLESIGNYAFSWALALKSVTFPASLRQLGQSCFSHCLSLTGDPFSLPEGITDIPQSCFMGSRALTRIALPSSIKSIGANAFYNSDLSEINLPEGLESVGDMAFYGCLLKEVTLPRSCGAVKGKSIFGLNNELVSLTLPDGMSVIPESIAEDCMSLTTVRLPGDVKIIGKSAFANCRVLRDISFPEGLEGIGNSAFKGCPAIEEIILPSSLVTLGQMAFCEMPALRRLYCKTQYPPMCEEYITNHEHGQLKGSFGEIDEAQASNATPRGIPVFVPAGSEDTYRNTWSWNYFTDIRGTLTFPDEAAVEQLAVDENAASISTLSNKILVSGVNGTAYAVYAIDGKIIEAGTVSVSPATIELPSGIYLVKAGTSIAKVAL